MQLNDLQKAAKQHCPHWCETVLTQQGGAYWRPKKEIEWEKSYPELCAQLREYAEKTRGKDL